MAGVQYTSHVKTKVHGLKYRKFDYSRWKLTPGNTQNHSPVSLDFRAPNGTPSPTSMARHVVSLVLVGVPFGTLKSKDTFGCYRVLGNSEKTDREKTNRSPTAVHVGPTDGPRVQQYAFGPGRSGKSN